MTTSTAPRIAIIGAGPGGITAAIKLREAGFDDITIYEKSASVGGVWNHNRYPGCACDVQSHLYSFSYAPKTDWSRPYSTQPEILAYVESVVDRFDLRPIIELESPVDGARWVDAENAWHLTVNGATVVADVVVCAVGMFNDLAYPNVDGLDSFAGTMFHSARWDQNHDLRGERIGVIGTAASAVQFLPFVAKDAGTLTVFQRTPQWVGAKEDTPYTPEQLERFANDPNAVAELRAEIFGRIDNVITFNDPKMMAAAEESGRRNLETVIDPVVRQKLTPTEPYGCRRPLSSNTYYPIYNQPNVELVTESIERVTERGIVTSDGVEREFDTIILGTGFAVSKYASAVPFHGRNDVAIDDAWRDGAHAYLGITTSGFPNLFMLYGPNTNNGSIIFMIECQVGYMVDAVARMRDGAIAALDVRADTMHAYNEQLQEDLSKVTVWNEGCNTGYYRAGPQQRIVTQWPHTMVAYQARTERVDLADFELTKR